MGKVSLAYRLFRLKAASIMIITPLRFLQRKALFLRDLLQQAMILS